VGLLLIMVLIACTTIQTARFPELALDVHDASLAFSGTTCTMDLTDPGRPRIIEVDMQGRVVWSYDIPQSIVLGGRPSRAPDVEWLAQSDHFLFVMPFKGVYEVNRQKKIVWRYETPHVSHDADRLPDGNTLMVFGGDIRSSPQVTEVNRDGQVVWQWFAAGRVHDEDRRTAPNDPTYTHANAVVRLPNGHTLVSLRNFHRIVEVDRAGNIVWQLGGLPFVHEPTPLPNGNLLVAIRKPTGVAEVTRAGGRVWSFQRDDVDTVRGIQPLPNGNVLLTERTKLLEVTRAGKVVWQLRLPGVSWDDPGHYAGRGAYNVRDQWFYKAQRIPG
jgi:hypothetical protein